MQRYYILKLEEIALLSVRSKSTPVARVISFEIALLSYLYEFVRILLHKCPFEITLPQGIGAISALFRPFFVFSLKVRILQFFGDLVAKTA